MRLNEVLQIAKNLQKINESYKSQTLQDYFSVIENSTIYFNVEIPNNKSFFKSALTDYDIYSTYVKLYYNNELTQDKLDDPQLRDNLFKNIRYEKKYTKTSKKYYDNSEKGFVINLLNQIRIKTDSEIGISELSDDNLQKISVEDSKKKLYKNKLQFWISYDNKLRAVTKDNTVICYITYENEYWYYSNKNYSGPTKIDLSLFSSKYSSYDIISNEQFKTFLNNAFNKLQVINVHFLDNEIKNNLGANNVKTLQNKLTDVLFIYAVNDEGMEKSDYSEIKKSRLEYKKFLEEQININIKNAERYKSIVKTQKFKTSEITQFIEDMLDVCHDSCIELQEKMLTILEDETIEHLSYYYYPSFNLNYKYNNLKTLLPNNISTYYSRRGKLTSESCQLQSYGDCFLVINLYIQDLLNKCKYLYDNIIKLHDMDRTNTEKNNIQFISHLIDQIKSNYTDIKKEKNYEYDGICYNVVYFLKRNKIDVMNILDNIKNL